MGKCPKMRVIAIGPAFRPCVGKGPRQSQDNWIEIIEYLGGNGRTPAVTVRNARGLVAV